MIGGRLGGGSEEGLPVRAEINVTSLVDVAFTLLVIFMITAPMLNAAVDLDLPEAEATTMDDPEGKLILSIDRNRKLFLGDTPVKWAELKEKLSTNQRVKVERELYIEGDKDLPYGVVVKAMALAKDAGVVKLMMVTDPNQHDDSYEDWDKMPSPPPKK